MSKEQDAARKLRAEIDHRHAATATEAGGSYLRNDAGELVADKSSVTTKPYVHDAEKVARETAAQMSEMEAAHAEAASRAAVAKPTDAPTPAVAAAVEPSKKR